MYLDFSGLEFAAIFLAAIMILGPMEAGAVHASQQGWDAPAAHAIKAH